MAVNVAEWASDNLVAVHAAERGTGGYMAGFAGLTPANTGIASGMHRVYGSITAPTPVPTTTFAPSPGDAGTIARFPRESDGDNSFILETSVRDLAFDADLQGSNVHTLGEWDIGVLGSRKRVFKNSMLLLTRYAQSMEASTREEATYENLIIPNSTLIPIGDDQFAWNEIGGSRYSGTLKHFDVLPWGVSAATAFTLVSGMTASWSSEYPCVMECFIGDGTITAIPLTHAPINVAKTKAFDFATSAPVTVSSVNVGSKTATVSAAPASGAITIVLYETLTF